MPDADTTPERPPRGGSRTRRPRFALPVDHHEELESDRTTERIEAFLDGPAPTRRTKRRHFRPPGVLRPRTVVPLESSAAWERAMHHEDERIARYGRPASVLVIEVRSPATGGVDHRVDMAALSAAIREQARETDHVARSGTDRFHVLLPETDEREATFLAERMVRAGREALGGDAATTIPGDATKAAKVTPSEVATVRASVASPAGGGTLVEALRVAGRRLDD